MICLVAWITAVAAAAWSEDDSVLQLSSAKMQHEGNEMTEVFNKNSGNISNISCNTGLPRIAKNCDYEMKVRNAWQADGATLASGTHKHESFTYDLDGFQMYGRLTRPNRPNGAGVVVVHTAAGPRDIFLHWKAEFLASLGYTVLIADMFGDQTGKGWEEEWRDPITQLLKKDRGLNRKRVRAAVAALAAVDGVDARRIGAIGFCFGGRAVLDLARLGANSGVAAVASFHGVLDDGVIAAEDMSSAEAPRVLICHGDADPISKPDARNRCEAQLRRDGARWDMLVFGGVAHAFTNPGQAGNPHPGFDYDEQAAGKSWTAVQALLSETIDPK